MSIKEETLGLDISIFDRLNETLSSIKDTVQDIKDIMSEWDFDSGLLDKLGSFIGIISAISGIAALFVAPEVAAFLGIASLIVSYLGSLGIAISEFVSEHGEDIAIWWEEKVKPWFTVEKWKELFDKLIENVGEWIGSLFGENWYENLVTWWEENIAVWFTIEKWQELFNNIMTNIGEWIGSIFGENWYENLVTWWEENIAPWFTLKKWRSLLNTVINNIGKWIGNIFGGNWGTKITDWWNTHIAPWFTVKKWRKLLNTVINNIGKWIGNIFGGNWGTKITNWWNTHIAPWFTIEKWAKLAKKAARGLADWLKLPDISFNVTWGKSPAWLYEAARLIGLSGVPDIDFNVSYKAKGGFADVGEMFIAREAGPELVGTIGNKTAVMNNNQIVESVSRGVYDAVAAAMGMNGVGGDWTIQIVDNNGNIKAEDIITAMERRNRRDGKTIIALGV